MLTVNWPAHPIKYPWQEIVLISLDFADELEHTEKMNSFACRPSVIHRPSKYYNPELQLWAHTFRMSLLRSARQWLQSIYGN